MTFTTSLSESKVKLRSYPESRANGALIGFNDSKKGEGEED
jgi:hypothetical protein